MLEEWHDTDPSGTRDKLDDAMKKIRPRSTNSLVVTDERGNYDC